MLDTNNEDNIKTGYKRKLDDMYVISINFDYIN